MVSGQDTSGVFSTNVFASFRIAATCFRIAKFDTGWLSKDAMLMIIGLFCSMSQIAIKCHIFQLTWISKTSGNYWLSNHSHIPVTSNKLLHDEIYEQLLAQ